MIKVYVFGYDIYISLLTSCDFHRASNSTVCPVSTDMFAIGISGSAAPCGRESASISTGVVNNSSVDEGELAGGAAGGGG